ncbi:nuclear transport factor 2 family protein [Umezawaea tangerina]|uniref:SnoaL-like domain-containing protein n=1 Tax=Umezawaea tangerina TaxID=84725 RepID=A0A2T0STF6_9PSEU|nr:nuclear transport factor 2 family protein [Umezawaea tangerina]PRY36702.1 hypothetical protein CLV43_11174 [Umezawaea tangerina]
MPHAPAVPDWLTRAFDRLAVGDVDGWADIYAPDAVHEIPFTADDVPVRLVGRETIAARLREVYDADAGRLRFGSFDVLRLHEGGDEVVVEGVGRHRRAADDTPVEIGCVWFITRHDGQVTHFRDYMNPAALAAHQLM